MVAVGVVVEGAPVAEVPPLVDNCLGIASIAGAVIVPGCTVGSFGVGVDNAAAGYSAEGTDPDRRPLRSSIPKP